MKNVHHLTVEDVTFSLLIILFALATLFMTCSVQLRGQTPATPADVRQKLSGFDQYMDTILKDWNCPGIAVGIVAKDKLVFAKGYGYRDYEKKLPVTSGTLFQIASNTKLFTAVSTGLLVEDKKLEWDKPVRQYVPTIQFYNDELNNTVTIHDMLSHRTGMSRHDFIWYKSDFSRKDLFERLKYLEPSQPLRTGFLYNNMMYISAGYIIELLSGKPWEDFVRQNIFQPLGMNNTVFTVKEMVRQDDHAEPFNEKRDTTLLYRIPIYEDQAAVGPAGSIISNVNDMSHWLIALMNDGMYDGKQVIPPAVIKATYAPSIAMPNTGLETKRYREIFNSVYGMGRWTASYRGHLLAYHGGDLPGLHSQVSCMPYDSIGVLVFVIGDQSQPLYNVVTYNVYERMLGLDQTPWSDRRLTDAKKEKALGREGRSKAGGDRVADAKPSHALADYTGEYLHPGYGIINVTQGDTGLVFESHRIKLPLNHYHYDRFDTPNDEEDGQYSLNFGTNPQGEIDRLTVSLDEAEATFLRMADASLADPNVLARYVGKYEQGGTIVEVTMTGNTLLLTVPGQPKYELLPSKPRMFKMKQFSDVTFEFVIENGRVKSMKQKDPSGEYELARK